MAEVEEVEEVDEVDEVELDEEALAEELEQADEALLAESDDSIACNSVCRSLESLAIDPDCGGGGGGGGGADALEEDVEAVLEVELGVWFAALSSA